MVGTVRLTSVSLLVCMTIVVVLIPVLYHIARRIGLRMTNTHQSQASRREELIQQRNDISRRLNNLQVAYIFIGRCLIMACVP